MYIQPEYTTEPIMVYVPIDQDEFDTVLANIAARAKAQEDKYKRDFLFKTYFYPLKNHFAQMRPSHAITSHKSQGSTFHSVYVHVQDIMLNKNRIEMLRALYVAITRSSTKLHLYGCGRRR
jgi:ATP-dependent exoDNAse (exonuclease V) alpha subunit